MRVGTNIVVAALHDPVRLAEDAAALSLMTGGRFELGVGLGYAERYEGKRFSSPGLPVTPSPRRSRGCSSGRSPSPASIGRPASATG